MAAVRIINGMNSSPPRTRPSLSEILRCSGVFDDLEWTATVSNWGRCEANTSFNLYTAADVLLFAGEGVKVDFRPERTNIMYGW